MVLLYSCGLAALAKSRTSFLAKMLTDPQIRVHGRTDLLLLGINYIAMDRCTKTIGKHKHSPIPTSEHLFEVLRGPLRRFAPTDAVYEDLFDMYEYLRALIYADLKYPGDCDKTRFWVPLGRYCWKTDMDDSSILVRIDREIDKLGVEWPLLKCGLFGGSVDRLREVKKNVDEFVRQLRMR